MLRSNKSQLLNNGKTKQPMEGLFCTYSHRVCMQNRLEGYEYCLKHILEDKNAPFKQCSYTSSKTGKRCTNASPKSDRKEGYCIEHARRALLIRQRACRKKRPKETPESLLEGLDSYASYGKKEYSGYGDIHEHRRSQSIASKALEYASSSDSDAETPVVDQAWRGDGDSDAESIDSEQEDPLKHAGVHTAEEVALIMRDKLIRLQSLYIDQFKRLQHVMREKRRKYLHTAKREKESFGTEGGLGQYAKDVDSQENWARYTAMKRYHRRFGIWRDRLFLHASGKIVSTFANSLDSDETLHYTASDQDPNCLSLTEALLHRQSKERRIAASEGANYKPPAYPRCIYSHVGEKCSNRVLPLTKYCQQHIMNDSHQVLYRQCSFGDGECVMPVASQEDVPYCCLHIRLQAGSTSFSSDSKDDPMAGEDLIDVMADNMDSSAPADTNIAQDTTANQQPASTTEQETEEALMRRGKLLLLHLKSLDAKSGDSSPTTPTAKSATITSNPNG